jgi:hypothetical protein
LPSTSARIWAEMRRGDPDQGLFRDRNIFATMSHRMTPMTALTSQNSATDSVSSPP